MLEWHAHIYLFKPRSELEADVVSSANRTARVRDVNQKVEPIA